VPERGGVRVARVYDAAEGRGAARRILVDRLWPRGVSKADAGLDEWLKDVAPSTELRKWYGHEPDRFEVFANRYRRELDDGPASMAVAHLVELIRTGPIVLVTATRDLERSGAQVLHDVLTARISTGRARGGPPR
jgi:uncharacterized protein YeaO (DUF488 family)